MLFHTEEWTINLDHVASIEWEDEYKDAEVYMNDGRSYTVGEGDDFDRLAAVVGRNNTLSPDQDNDWMSPEQFDALADMAADVAAGLLTEEEAIAIVLDPRL